MHIKKVFNNDFLSQPGTGISNKYDTTVSKNGHFEKRNSRIEFPYLDVNVNFSDRSIDSSIELAEFFNEMKGRANTFRFRNPLNFSTNGNKEQTIKDNFMYYDDSDRLQKDLKFRMYNKITGKPISIIKYGTLIMAIVDDNDESNTRLYIDDYENRVNDLQNIYPNYNILDIEKAGDSGTTPIFDINYEEGVLTTIDRLTYSRVNTTHTLYLSCEFYYKVRFDTDNLVINYNGFDFVSADEFTLIEVNN